MSIFCLQSSGEDPDVFERRARMAEMFDDVDATEVSRVKHEFDIDDDDDEDDDEDKADDDEWLGGGNDNEAGVNEGKRAKRKAQLDKQREKKRQLRERHKRRRL